MTQIDHVAARSLEAKQPISAVNRFWSRWLETPRCEAQSHDWLGWDAWVSPDRPDGR